MFINSKYIQLFLILGRTNQVTFFKVAYPIHKGTVPLKALLFLECMRYKSFSLWKLIIFNCNFCVKWLKNNASETTWRKLSELK